MYIQPHSNRGLFGGCAMSATDHGWSHTGYRLSSKIHKEKLTIQSTVNYCSEISGKHFDWLWGYLPTWPIFNTFRKMHVIALPRFSNLCIQTTKDNVNPHDCEIHQMEDKFEKQDGALRDWVSPQEIVTIFTNDQKASWHDWIGQIDRLVWVEYANPMLDSC